jgi:MtN3 and saliva related transmembrane protein
MLSFISVDALGYLAACLTTFAFVPQAWLTWKQRKAEGVSLSMYCIFVSGLFLWLLYGIALGSKPIIISNIVTLSLACFILGMKLRFG